MSQPGKVLQFDNSPAERRAHSVSGGRSRGYRFAHVVEGELVSTSQIMARLGVGRDCVLARVKAAPHPLTWAALEKRRR